MQGNLNSNTENYLTKSSVGVPEYKPDVESFEKKERDLSDKNFSGYKREKVRVQDALEEFEDVSMTDEDDYDDGLTNEEFKSALELELERQLAESIEVVENKNGHFQEAMKKALEKAKDKGKNIEEQDEDDSEKYKVIEPTPFNPNEEIIKGDDLEESSIEEVDREESTALETQSANDEQYDPVQADASEYKYPIPTDNNEDGQKMVGHDDFINLERSQWKDITDRKVERAEYLRLKHEFKESQKKYLDAVAEDYTTRDHVSKLLGLGRNNMSESVEEAYKKYLSANTAYLNSGIYQKIEARINRDEDNNLEAPKEKKSIDSAVVGRHYLSHIEKRQEIQTTKLMPENLSKVLGNISGHIRKHPKIAITAGVVALGVGGAMAGAVATGMYAGKVGLGFATRYAGGWVGNKTLLKGKEDRLKSVTYEATNKIREMDEEALEKYEREISKAFNSVERTRTGIKVASRAAGLGVVGAAFAPDVLAPEVIDVPATDYTPDNLPTGDSVPNFNPQSPVVPEDVPAPVVNEQAPLSEVAKGWADSESLATPESVGIETLHTVKEGDTLSKVIFDQIEKRLTADSVNLPERAMGDGKLMSFMLEKFPEFSNSSDISPTLTPDQWQRLGVSSGNPHMIFYDNDVVNIDAIIKIMEGQPIKEVLDSLPELESVGHVDEPVSAFSGSEENLTLEEAEQFAPKYADDHVIDAPRSFETVAESSPITTAEENTVSAEAVPTEVPASNETSSEVPVSVPEASEVESLDTETDDILEDSDMGLYKISSDFENIEHQFTNIHARSMHEYLSQVISEGVRSGQIVLPMDMVTGDTNFAINPEGLVEYRLPEVSNSPEAKRFFLFSKDPTLTPDQWRQLGISSGDPREISPEDVFNSAKLIEYIVGGNKELLPVVESN